MASPLDPAPAGAKRPVAAPVTSQVQEGPPSPSEARQVEQLIYVKPNTWRRIQAFSGSSQMKACLLFLPPALLIFTLFVTWPVVEAAYYSFFNWNGYGAPSKWIGLENFQRVLNDPIFYHSLFNNLLIVLVSALIQVPLALSLALLISDKSRSSVVFRAIFFLPYILGEIVAGLIWRYMYDGNYGVVAVVYRWFGQEAPEVLATEGWATAALLLVVVWKYFGFHMALFVAGRQGIDEQRAGGGQNRRCHPLADHLEHRSAPDAPGGSAVPVLQHPGFIAGFRHNRFVNRWGALQFDPLGSVLPLQLRHQTHAGRLRQRDRGDAVRYLCVGDGVL